MELICFRFSYVFSCTADALESLRQSCEFVCPNDGFLEQVCCEGSLFIVVQISFLITNQNYDFFFSNEKGEQKWEGIVNCVRGGSA